MLKSKLFDMEVNQQTTKAYFRVLKMIHLILTLAIVAVGLVVSFFVTDFQQPDTESELAKLFVYLVPGLVVVGIVASNVIFQLKLNELKERVDLKSKTSGYNASLVIRYYLLEFPGLFALVAILVTSNINFMIYAVLMVVLLILKRPTLKSAIADLALDQREVAILENPDSIIE